MRKKFSRKNKLTTPTKQAAAGRALETRLEKWQGRTKKRVRRHGQTLTALRQRVTDLENTVEGLKTQMQALQTQLTPTP